MVAFIPGLAFCLAIFINFTAKKNLPDEPAPLIENSAVPAIQPASAELVKKLPEIFGLPVRLKIPKINVDASLDYVGLTPDGAVDVPRGATTAAWFDLGPRPGNNGDAVITGHYGPWKNGQGSVFDDLDKLKKGDSLSIEDEKGKIAIFVVRESKKYNPKDDAPEVFGSNDGKAHLNLITCQGEWNSNSLTYSQRLVVFTDKE